MTNYDDTPPCDHNAEQAVLGVALHDPAGLPGLRNTLQPKDFWNTLHQTIWNALCGLHDAGAPITPATLLQALQAAGKADTGPYLHELFRDAPTPSTAGYFTTQLTEATRRRETLNSLTRLTQIASNGATPDDFDEGLARHIHDLQTINEHRQTTTDTGLTDLTWLLTGQPPVVQPPTWIRRTDGHALLYAGRVNGIFGDPETAKTWLAHLAVIEALDQNARATIIDVDHNGPTLTTRNLLLLGAKPHHLANPDLFRYHEPQDSHELRAAITALVDWAPAVAVLDSIGEMLPMLAVKSVDNDEITNALRTLAKPLADAGACVITVDHLPKNTEARNSGYAIGGTAKKRAIDGTYLEATVRVQPAPGKTGKITLRVHKDRPGELRKNSQGNYAGTFLIDSTREHITVTSISCESATNDAGAFRPTHLMEAVSKHIEMHSGVTKSEVEIAVKGRRTAVSDAIERLLEEGFLSNLGTDKRPRLHSMAAYREDEDDD